MNQLSFNQVHLCKNCSRRYQIHSVRYNLKALLINYALVHALKKVYGSKLIWVVKVY